MTLRDHRAARRTSRRRLAYTIVEVMVGLSILAIGATGIIALQKTSIVGNLYARNLVIASHVAETWIERLKTDALAWNSDQVADMAETTWIKDAPFPAEWIQPAEVADNGSPAADVAGKDLYGGGDVAFCTHIRLTPLLPDDSGPNIADAELVRLEVRVFFSKTNQTIDALDCPTGAPTTTADAFFSTEDAHAEYGFVYHTSAIRRNTINP